MPADNPIIWLGIGNNPTSSSVDSLVIDQKIALLNQAISEFERLKFVYLNSSPDEFVTGGAVGTLRGYNSADFSLLPRATPENYQELLRLLGQRVRSLRLIQWPAAFIEKTLTDQTNVHEHIVFDDPNDVNNDEDYGQRIELHDQDHAVVESVTWKPASIGSGNLSVEVSDPHTSVRVSLESELNVEGRYTEDTNNNEPKIRSQVIKLSATYPEEAKISATAPGSSVTQVNGTVYVLHRSHFHQIGLSAASSQYEPNNAAYLVDGSGNSGAVSLFDSPPAATVNGSWATTLESSDTGGVHLRQTFVENGYLYKKNWVETGSSQYSGNYLHSYEKNWQTGCVFHSVFKPTFTRGVDASAMRPKLESADAVLADNSADGNFLLRPRPSLLFGINLGPGLKGAGNGLIGVRAPQGHRLFQHENYDYENDFGFVGINWRFDSTYSLSFAGSDSDYHVVYANNRAGRTQALPADRMGWLNASENYHYFGNRALYYAWEKPRLTQVAGRDLIANIEYNTSHYGGYTVRIYRRPSSSAAPTPGQVLSTAGMTPIRTWIFSHPGAGTSAHPNDAEKLEVTDGGNVKYQLEANQVLTSELLESSEYGAAIQIGWWWWLEGTWSWTFKTLDDNIEKYRQEVEITTLYDEELGLISKAVVDETIDGNEQAVTSLSSFTLDPFNSFSPEDWEITTTGKTITGTATLGEWDDPASGYGKWPLSVSIQYDGIQPDAQYTWNSNGLLASATQGLWKTAGVVVDNAYAQTQKFNDTVYATTWTEFPSGGNKVKSYSAPDGNVTNKTDTAVAWSEIEYGTATTGIPGLPNKLTRNDGSGAKWTWQLSTDLSGSLTVESGNFSGNNLTTGTRSNTSWNARGHTIESQAELIASGTVTVASSTVPSGQFTAWGSAKEWKDLHTGLSTLINQDGGLSRLASVTSPLGLTSAYSDYDVFNRPKQVVSNGITATNTFTGLGLSTSYSGSGVAAGSQSSFTQNAIGTSTASSSTWGGVTQTSNTERGASNTTVTGGNSLLGSSGATIRNNDGSLTSSTSSTLAFGGVAGDALTIANGLFVSKSAVADVPGTFAETHTDAWGRTRKIVTPSKTSGSTQTLFSYSLPSATLKRIITTDPTGQVFITESDANGTINRSGVDVNGNGSLGASDRYTESTTEVVSGKVVTTLSVTEDSGMREAMKSEWTPASGITVTKINGNEETITTTPNYTNKTVKTESSKGWERTTGVNNLGLATTNTLSGTGIPTTSLTPVWRADGSLASVSLNIGGETHTASFNADSTLATLTAPGRGNILGGHSISNGVETLTVNGTTGQKKLDGTEKSISGANVIAKSEVLSTNGGGYKKTITPAIGAATHNTFNAALATTAKTYADNSIEAYGYAGELLSSITLARGGAITLGYSNDGAKDLTAATWPAIASGVFTIPSVGHGFTYNRSGQIKTLIDPSGSRALGYQNGRLAGATYTAGILKGYEIIPGRDEYGRQTGTLIKRDGHSIHTTAKALSGASDQITNLASGNITATPQRDGAGRITGYIWSDGTNNVSQTWTRGAGGRIEKAESDVTGAPSFDYLIDPETPEESFDAYGRRLKSLTAGGTWTYVYGSGGQLTSATHPTLGTFTYSFDGIGRRTDKGSANTSDNLNRTTAWTNSQNKNITIKAHPDARVWFNGVEIENFTGTHSAAVTSPGAQGGWVPWETLTILEGAGEGAGNPAANPLASPDAKSEKKGAVWVPPIAETLTYDAAGNRVSSGQWDYGWDAKNQLTRVRTKNHTTAPQAYDLTFTYDSEGRRIKKHVIEYQNGAAVSEKIITFVWDGWDLLYERHQLPSGLTLLERKYLWGPDIADGAAGGAGGLLLISETKGNNTQNIIPLYDGTGHVIALTDINKNLLAVYAYGPFGEKISAEGSQVNSNPWRWGTKYLDQEIGLYYYGHRFFDPITGTWISRDPLGENETLNLYQFGSNDPINHVDVHGLATFAISNDVPKAELIEELLRIEQPSFFTHTKYSDVDSSYLDQRNTSHLSFNNLNDLPILSAIIETNREAPRTYVAPLHPGMFICFLSMHELDKLADSGLYDAETTEMFREASQARSSSEHKYRILSGTVEGFMLIGQPEALIFKGAGAGILGLKALGRGSEVLVSAGRFSDEIGELGVAANTTVRTFDSGGSALMFEYNAAKTTEDFLHLADKLDVSTARNAAVFYSGRGNRELAEAFALQNGRMTLEMTRGGQFLDDLQLFAPNSPLTPEQATQVWSRLSQRFAAEASGNATGFVHGARAEGIFNTVEFPALRINPKITNVITGGN